MNNTGQDIDTAVAAEGRIPFRWRWLFVTEGMLWCIMVMAFAGWAIHVCARRAGGTTVEWRISASAPMEEAGKFFWRVDINQADASELMLLPGIGPKRARLIVEEREKNGPYLSAASLARIKGIGPKTAKRLAPYVTTGK